MGKIVLEDFNEGNGYYKVNLAYLNKEQVKEIENLVSKWNPTDEDIKSCIGMCLTDVNEQRFKDYGTNLRDCLAWLERQGEQKPIKEKMITPEESLGIDSNTYNEIVDECIYGEQKPTDKVEPKFHEGEWVVYECGEETSTLQIARIFDIAYVFSDGSTLGIVDEDSLRLWDIAKDAKDGDILVVENIIFIYKRALSSHIVSYCKLINDVFEPTVDARTCCEGNPYVHPATKEQRDLLFSKMREFGYEWDTKEKQLMKVPRKVQAIGVLKQLIDEQKSVDVEEPDFFDDFRNSDVEVDSNEDGLIAATIKYKNEQNPAWSEDDENMLRRVFDSLNTYAKNAYPCLKSVVEEEINWLKSIKERTKGE